MVGSWVKYVPLEVPLGAAPCQKMYSFSDVFPWLPTVGFPDSIVCLVHPKQEFELDPENLNNLI